MKNRRLSWLSAPYVLWMALFVVIPLIVVVVYAFTKELAGGAWVPTLENFAGMAGYAAVFARSFLLAAIATVICILIGYPAAYLLTRTPPGFRRVANMLIMLPMWMNFLLRTYSWMAILENNGLLNQFFDAIGLFDLINGIFGTDIQYFRMIRTQGAVVLGMVYNYLPFMILPIYTVMKKMDRRVIEAAEDLGAPPRTVFARVVIPLSLPGVVSGITMVFMPAVTTFAISRLLGNGMIYLIGDAIENYFITFSNRNVGSALSLVLMVLIIISIGLLRKADPKGEGGALW